MLASITKKYCDHSTDKDFAFSFFCDYCGDEWKSEVYAFSLCDSPAETEAEKRAHEILWKAEHDAAYERANNEAILHFNKCQSCGDRVCDNCFCIFEDVCLHCSPSEEKITVNSLW